MSVSLDGLLSRSPEAHPAGAVGAERPLPWASTGPRSVAYQNYSPVGVGQTVSYALPNQSGMVGLSLGVMNSTIQIQVFNGTTLIFSTTIQGGPTNYTVIEGSAAYGFHNFDQTATASVTAENVGETPGLLAYDCYDGPITSYTASLITYPPQYAVSIAPMGPPSGTISGLSFSLVAPTYSTPIPLAIWVGGGFNASGAFWWAQIGFTNWQCNTSSYNVSYAGWGILSNIAGIESPGGVDCSLPLVPGQLYNFTMELTNGTTWAFEVNGTPIVEPGPNGTSLNGTYTTSSSQLTGDFDLGLETLTPETSSVNITQAISIPSMFVFRVGSAWVEPNGAYVGPGGVGENWWNGNTTGANGIALWGLAGALEDASVAADALLVNDSLPRLAIAPISLGGMRLDPLFGFFSVAPATSGPSLVVVARNQSWFHIQSLQPTTIVDALGYSLNAQYQVDELTSLESYLVTSRTALVFRANTTDVLIAATNLSYAAVAEQTSFVSAYPVVFNETGLPSGAAWSVNISGQPYLGGTNRTLATWLPNGTYTYTLAAQVKNATAAGGSFKVAGKPALKPIVFLVNAFVVAFEEKGLPGRTLATEGWSVELNGTELHRTGGTIDFTVAPGVLSVLVTGPSGYQAQGLAGVVPGGSLAVRTATQVVVTFVKKPTVTLVFQEKGLPKGQSWCVEIDGEQLCSSTAGLRYTGLTPGSYAYSVVAPRAGQRITAKLGPTAIPTSGNLTVEKSATVALTFVYPYLVTFRLAGLPVGAGWSAALNGLRLSSTGPSIEFNESNGTYRYQVSAASGGNLLPAGSKLVVDGSARTIFLSAFAVRFNESGLPNGSAWSVTLNKLTLTNRTAGDLGTIVFFEGNGTYSFSVRTRAGSTVTPRSGKIVVSNGSQTIDLCAYAVTFNETGLPNGTVWSVTVGGVTLKNATTAGQGTIVFYEGNGSWAYKVGSVTGFSRSGVPKRADVAGGPVYVSVTFSAQKPSPS